MRAKTLTAFALSALLCIQMLPTVSLAAGGADSALEKAPGYQEFPAYYSDSHHADNQVTHPDVVVMDEAWNGYRYWALYTPNVSRISIYENPSIVASADGVNWVTPEGLTNPIEVQPGSTRYHNCDGDMIYNPRMDAMMAYWNWADDQAGGVGAEVRLRISYDGVHWGVPVTYDSATRQWAAPTSAEERQVSSGAQDYIAVVKSTARYDMLSPTFLYDSYRDSFFMWANDAGDVGYNNGQANYVRMWSSKDGVTWGDPVRVNNFLGVDEAGRQLAPWHQDVQYVSELKLFLAASQCFSGNNPDGSVLHLTSSRDGINWEQVGTKPLLRPGADGSWDDFQIYRSTFYYEPGSTVGGGTVRVWYAALQKNTNSKMVPDASGNLTIQAKDQDDRIWRIGYAENSYTEMMRVLLDDPAYAGPELVTGEALSLSMSDTLPLRETAQLQVAFTPADTSDQIVKYTTSAPDVATVDNLGVVTAVGIGTAVITGRTREGLSASVSLTVVENPYLLIPQSSMTASATSVYAGTTEGPAANVLDGDPATIWHTNYNPKDTLPQSLSVSLGQTRSVNKYVYTPRQSGTNGMVTKYELYAVKADGTSELIAGGNWEADASDKVLTFDPAVEAESLELKVLEGVGGFGTAAEINVYSNVEPAPEPAFTVVNDRDPLLVYTGDWHDDSNTAFQGGTARYTNSADASVSLTFTGTAVRWFGQKDVNFGTANVFIDDELVGTVNAEGPLAVGQLLFEESGLAAGEHTIRVERATKTIDLDYFSYAEQ